MQFTLRQLQLFVAACETGSITLAAEREHISQSAVSSAIFQLERSTNLQLLIRHHAQGVTPSPAGRHILNEARAILASARTFERLVEDLSDSLSGHLELGCLVTLAPIILPTLCRTFQMRYPGSSFTLLEDGQEALLGALLAGTINLALTYDLGLDDRVSFSPLAALPPVALLPFDHPLAGKESLTLAELAPEPLFLLDLPLSRDYFLSLFAEAGVTPTIAHRSPNVEMVRSMVAGGFGYSLLNARPVSEQSLDGGRVAMVPLAGNHRPMQLGIARLAQGRETRLVRAFREHCGDVISGDRLPGMTTVP